MSGDVETGRGASAPQPAVAAAIPVPEPTPVVAAAEATRDHPAGTAAPSESSVIGPADKPELAVGAAFAGGLVLAFILKRIAS
jgi:hypothetical protein